MFPKEVEEKHETFVYLFQWFVSEEPLKEGFVSRTRRAAEPLFFCFFCFKNRSKKTTNNGIVCLFQEGFVSKRSRRKNEIFCFKKKKKHQTRRQLTTNKVLFQEKEETQCLFQEKKGFLFLFCCSKKRKEKKRFQELLVSRIQRKFLFCLFVSRRAEKKRRPGFVSQVTTNN